MIITLLAFAAFRKFGDGISVAGSCSTAISAACHGMSERNGSEWDHELPAGEVSYGELGRLNYTEKWKAGFGVGRIYQLSTGRSYI